MPIWPALLLSPALALTAFTSNDRPFVLDLSHAAIQHSGNPVTVAVMTDQMAQQLIDKLSIIEGHLQQMVLALGKLAAKADDSD